MSELRTFQNRLVFAMKAKDKKQIDIVKALDVSKGTVSNWYSGKTEPEKPELLAKLANFLGVDIKWLAIGEGKLGKKPSAQSDFDGDDFMAMEFWDGDTPLDDEEFEVSFYKDVEFFGGDGYDGGVYDDGRRKLRYAMTAAKRAGVNPNAVVCTTLKGDSMEELILSGSMIAIDKSKKEIRDGKIYAFRHNDMLRVKYLIRRPDGGLIIRSHNPRYKDEIITGDEIEAENIQIIGWVWNWSSLLVW